MRTDTLYFNTESSFFLFQRQVKCMIHFIGILPQKLLYWLKIADACATLRATKITIRNLYFEF